MALPSSLSTCTVAGTYVDLVGNPIRGSITFKPQTILKETTLNVIIMPTAITKTLDANGSFSVVLPVTSDTDVVPQPFIYILTENFTGGRVFEIALPLSVAGTTQNLADLLPALTATEAAAYVSIEQYQGLLVRYTTADDVRADVVDADVYDSNTHTAATLASQASERVVKFNANQLMMMGV
jgi:hypothetical protein